jgi:hypothetical protein
MSFTSQVLRIASQEMATRLRKIVPVDTGRLKNTVRFLDPRKDIVTLRIDPVSPNDGIRYGTVADDVVTQYINSNWTILLDKTTDYVIKREDY